MLSGNEFTVLVVHESEVRRATAHGEHRLAARLAAKAGAKGGNADASGWRVWKRLGASRGERKAS
jgi:hypothetical protein